jgi:hypothetical protein
MIDMHAFDPTTCSIMHVYWGFSLSIYIYIYIYIYYLAVETHVYMCNDSLYSWAELTFQDDDASSINLAMHACFHDLSAPHGQRHAHEPVAPP